MNVVAELAVAMGEGMAKYGKFNFRALDVRASVYFDAVMRHLIAWQEGEDLDPDSGMSHVTKAIATLFVLRDAMMRGRCADDRPPKSVPFMEDCNKKAAIIREKYKECDVKHYTQEDKV